MTLAQLERRLASAPPALVYLVEGGEPFLRTEALRLIRGALARGGSPPEVREIRATETDIASLLDDLRTPSLFASRRMMIVEDAAGLVTHSTETIIAYARKPARNATLVLLTEGLKTNEQPLKALVKVVAHVSCPAPREHEVPHWCVQRARRHGKRMTLATARRLVDLAGTNLGQLDGHIRSLAVFVAQRSSISSDDVDGLVGGDHARRAWEISDAVLQRDAAAALRALDRLVREPGDGHLAVIPALSGRMSEAFAAKRLSESGQSPAEIARRLRRHPYFVKRLLESTNHLSYGAFADVFSRLLEADLEIKTLPNRERRWVLERLLLDLCGAGALRDESRAPPQAEAS